MPIELSFCIVNTDQRDQLMRCLDAVQRERLNLPFTSEVLVLDNASQDGSSEAAEKHSTVDRVIKLERRSGKAANDTLLLKEATGRYCLLLNEDAELKPGSVSALYAAMKSGSKIGAVGAALLNPQGVRQPSAWRFPTPATALLSLLLLHKLLVVQSRGERTKEVDWAQSAALMVRKEAAAQIDYLDEQFFVYSDEVDFCKRLSDAGWQTLYVPAAEAIHYEQLSHGALPERRIVEFSRNRERYMRKHHSPIAALTVRYLTALTYGCRALAAVILPGHSARRYWRHVTATLRPWQSEGLREAAEATNRVVAKGD